MSQTNSAANTLQEQLHLQASSAATSAESLMSNAFDLIGGATAAQQFLNHMDLYAQQQRQQQQQQQQQQQLNQYNHHQQQQQQQLQLQQQQQLQHHQQQQYHQSQQQSITSSSSTSSSPSTIQTNYNQHQHQQHHHHHLHHHQQQQQHTPPRVKQQHSISLTSSPISSPIKSATNAIMSTAATSATVTPPTNLLIVNSNQHFNHQMDTQQQQNGSSIPTAAAVAAAAVVGAQTPLRVTNTSPLSTTVSGVTSAAGALISPTATSAAALSATSPSALSTDLTHQHQHQHHQHSHHQHGSNGSPYKSCWCFGDSYHMKILVPAVASGAIIGKGGETIASLQKDSGARVKMSKSHDFYPGTNERVCLITGSIDGIMTVVDFIMDKIREKPDLTTKIMDIETKQQQERDKQVKILVPNSTAGMIIGKGGAFIKQIKEESGSYVQISQKPKDISLQERCITIIGDKENNKNACKLILSKIVEDPQSGACLNVSYADMNGPVANFNPTGSPYATNQNAINSSNASLNSNLGSAMGGGGAAAGLLVNGTGINLSLNLGSPNPAPNLAVATQLLEHIKVAMRGSGYSENATTEVCAALGVLAKYGVLGMGVGVPHANGAHATTLGSYLGVSALDQQSAAAASAATGNVFGAVGQVNLEQYTAAAAAAAAAAAGRPTQSQLEAAAAQFDPFRHLSQAGQAATPVSMNNNSFGLTAATGTGPTAQQLSAAAMSGMSKSPTPGDLGPKDTKNVEIPEVIVGAILGPNGRSLIEIQHASGASVQISKKGIFAPGTRNRIVTITGQLNAIAKAQFLIEQKINEEETKRARQIPLTTVVN